MPNESLEDLRELIDNMQAGLVELFNQLHELKRRLNIAERNADEESEQSVLPIFAKVSKVDTTQDDILSDAYKEYPESETASAISVAHPEKVDTQETPLLEAESSSTPETRIARVLDPIQQELQTGESPAEVLAEYVQAAKDYLLPNPLVNERVAHDMDVVLKFLRARGKRLIRNDERDNILKRIGQWKAHLIKEDS
ncbi:MAG: hypothetical protein EAX81_02730 [Candidatus Thorarchaeota archaeon]|nr:hypothetical protein [Candidatus Thorarchaeota archaeon]